MPILIRTEIFPGDVRTFQANMERLSNLQDRRWTSAAGDCLVFYKRTRQELVAVTETPTLYEKWGKLPPTKHYRCLTSSATC